MTIEAMIIDLKDDYKLVAGVVHSISGRTKLERCGENVSGW